MAPRKRKCDTERIWLLDLTRFFFGLVYAAYILLVTVLLSRVFSIMALPETLHQGIWVAVVVYGAPLGLTRGMARHGILRVLRNLQSIEPINGEKEK